MCYRLSAFLAAYILLCAPTLSLKVGVTAGPHADIIYKLKEIAQKQDLKIDVVEFNDFIQPNEALDTKALDINSYQHEPFLKSQVESRGYKLKAIAKTVVMPLGVYSTKLKSLADIPQGAKITIPNDPTNGGRALKLLAKHHLIELEKVDNPSVLNIRSNPKKINFIEIEAPLLPPSLPDVDASVINTDWVLLSGLDPKSALVQEDKDSPYTNVLVVRCEEGNREDIQKFVKLYQSPEIQAFIETTYKGAVIPAW